MLSQDLVVKANFLGMASCLLGRDKFDPSFLDTLADNAERYLLNKINEMKQIKPFSIKGNITEAYCIRNIDEFCSIDLELLMWLNRNYSINQFVMFICNNKHVAYIMHVM